MLDRTNTEKTKQTRFLTEAEGKKIIKGTKGSHKAESHLSSSKGILGLYLEEAHTFMTKVETTQSGKGESVLTSLAKSKRLSRPLHQMQLSCGQIHTYM